MSREVSNPVIEQILETVSHVLGEAGLLVGNFEREALQNLSPAKPGARLERFQTMLVYAAVVASESIFDKMCAGRTFAGIFHKPASEYCIVASNRSPVLKIKLKFDLSHPWALRDLDEEKLKENALHFFDPLHRNVKKLSPLVTPKLPSPERTRLPPLSLPLVQLVEQEALSQLPSPQNISGTQAPNTSQSLVSPARSLLKPLFTESTFVRPQRRVSEPVHRVSSPDPKQLLPRANSQPVMPCQKKQLTSKVMVDHEGQGAEKRKASPLKHPFLQRAPSPTQACQRTFFKSPPKRGAKTPSPEAPLERQGVFFNKIVPR